jgi:hypothetical protein
MTLLLKAASWADVLASRGLRALPQSQFVPIDAWLVYPRSPSHLLRLVARGTRVRLTSYDRSDLTTLLLRAGCDCEEHRQAGAAGRPGLRPGAAPAAEAVYDGAQHEGWTGVEAGLLRPDDVAPVLDGLLSLLEADDLADAPLRTRTA